jgi:hypothetical protein
MKERLRITFFPAAGVVIEDLPEYGDNASETTLQNNVVSLYVDVASCTRKGCGTLTLFAGTMFGAADALWR